MSLMGLRVGTALLTLVLVLPCMCHCPAGYTRDAMRLSPHLALTPSPPTGAPFTLMCEGGGPRPSEAPPVASAALAGRRPFTVSHQVGARRLFEVPSG